MQKKSQIESDSVSHPRPPDAGHWEIGKKVESPGNEEAAGERRRDSVRCLHECRVI